MSEFNYKNAYKLAVRTNKELHDTIDSYTAMLEELQQELERVTRENDELRRTIKIMQDPVF